MIVEDSCHERKNIKSVQPLRFNLANRERKIDGHLPNLPKLRIAPRLLARQQIGRCYSRKCWLTCFGFRETTGKPYFRRLTSSKSRLPKDDPRQPSPRAENPVGDVNPQADTMRQKDLQKLQQQHQQQARRLEQKHAQQ
jgi:hypothetical protein